MKLVIGIMGASGSGKSTLMNRIGILDTPTRGDVFIKHHKVSDISENERARVSDNHLLWTKTGTDMYYMRAGDLNRDGADDLLFYERSYDASTGYVSSNCCIRSKGRGWCVLWGKSALRGDLNFDGALPPADAVIALQMAVSGECCPDSDVNGNGAVTSLDAMMILQAAAGAIDSL